MASTEIQGLESRLRAAEAGGEARVTIDALNDLAWALRLTEVERARSIASQARDLAIESDHALGQARAVRTMSMTTIQEGGVRAALGYAEEARRLFDEHGDRAGSAGARDFLATLHEFIGDLGTGLDHALDALAIAREIGDRRRQGYALSSVGGILGASGDVDGAFPRLEEALALFEDLADTMGIGRICSRLSTLARAAGRLDEALMYAKRSHEVSLLGDNMYAKAAALGALGELERENGNAPAAERLLREALAAFPHSVRGGFGASAQVSLGRLLADRSAFAEAETELTAALDRIIRFGVSPADEASAHEALAELSERQGKLSKAIAHLRDAIRLRERATQSEVRSRLMHVEVREEMKAARKDAEIHRLKFVELRDMHTKLVEAEKMAALGTLAAGTAHELNSPLGVLRSNLAVCTTAATRLAALAQPQTDHSAEVAKLVMAVNASQSTGEEACHRISAVAETFQRFTQLDRSERRTFNVMEGLESALALLEQNLPEGVSVHRQLDDVASLLGWPRQLNQAFMTVLMNASEAIDGTGRVSVETAMEGGHVVVRIRDTGRGMSDKARSQLFDVSWSDDGARVRMRLGLSATYATVRRHKGTIDVVSEVGRGTTVVFRFPARP